MCNIVSFQIFAYYKHSSTLYLLFDFLSITPSSADKSYLFIQLPK